MKTLVFNDTQITSPRNGNNPKWNDPCHTLSATDRPPIVVMAFSHSGFADYAYGETIGTLRASGGDLGGQRGIDRGKENK